MTMMLAPCVQQSRGFRARARMLYTRVVPRVNGQPVRMACVSDRLSRQYARQTCQLSGLRARLDLGSPDERGLDMTESMYRQLTGTPRRPEIVQAVWASLCDRQAGAPEDHRLI